MQLLFQKFFPSSTILFNWSVFILTFAARIDSVKRGFPFKENQVESDVQIDCCERLQKCFISDTTILFAYKNSHLLIHEEFTIEQFPFENQLDYCLQRSSMGFCKRRNSEHKTLFKNGKTNESFLFFSLQGLLMLIFFSVSVHHSNRILTYQVALKVKQNSTIKVFFLVKMNFFSLLVNCFQLFGLLSFCFFL